MRRTAAAAALLAVAYAALYLAFDRLAFPRRGDEWHFWRTALKFSQHTIPPLEFLRSYGELNTPLPFLLWGWMERAWHQGIWLARLLNLLLSAAMTWTIVAAAGPDAIRRGGAAALGLFLCPYFVWVSTHAYTDTLAMFFTVVGVSWHLNGWSVGAAACFILAVASRQFVVAFPAGLLAWELIRGGLRLPLRQWIAPAAGLVSLFGWYLFFGGFAPVGEVAEQRLTAKVASIDISHALYFLACVGLYFAAPRFLLFGLRGGAGTRVRTWLTRDSALIAAGLLVLFIFFAPVLNEDDSPTTMGYFDRALHALGLNEPVRRSVFYGFALAAVLTVRRHTLALVLLLANAAVMVKAHQAWDKYALPMLAVLWYLEARRRAQQTPNA